MSDIQRWDLPEAVEELRGRVERLEQQSPVAGGLARNGEGSDSPRSGPSRSAACGVTDGGPAPATGLRKERVTLEVTRPKKPNYPAPAASFMWQHLLRDVVQGDHESVRVVEEAHFDDLAQLAMERDAAIRVRDEARGEITSVRGSWHVSRDANDVLRARLAELEAERDDALEQVAELERAALQAEQQAAAEPVAWGRRKIGGGPMFYITEKPATVRWEGEEIIPLYTAPPPAAGWLTGEERELIAGITDDDDYTEDGQNIAKALLARNAPPKVVLPRVHCYGGDGKTIPLVDLEDVQAALAAAGVECE